MTGNPDQPASQQVPGFANTQGNAQNDAVCGTALQVKLSFLLVAFVVLTLAVYWPGLSGPFVMDDQTSIRTSTLESLDFSALQNLMASNRSGILGRPVAVLSLGLTYLAHGLDPFDYKYFNLMLHLLIGLTACWLFGRLLSQPGTGLDCRNAWTIAAITAGLWLIHPLLLSTVLYPSQRMAQFSTLFTLIGLLLYVFARERMLRGQAGRAFVLMIGTTLSAVLAVLSKENGALVVVYLFTLELLLFRFRTGNKPASAVLYGYWVLLVAGGMLLAGYLLMFNDSLFESYAIRDFTLEQRLLTQCGVLWYYVSLIVFPRLREIGLVHDDYPLTTSPDLGFALAVAGLVAAVGIALVLHRKAPIIALGIAWFLVGHLVESTVFPLELVFDHRNYLPAFGVLLLVALLLVRLGAAAPRYRRLIAAIALLFVAHWGFMTWTQAHTWTSLDTMAAVAVEEHPGSVRAHTEFANRLYFSGERERAIFHIDRAISLNPKASGARVHKLVFHCNQEQLPDALFTLASESLANYHPSSYTLVALNVLQSRKSVENCPAITHRQVIRLLQQALDNPANPPYFKFVLTMLQARALAFSGDLAGAFAAYESAFSQRDTTSPSQRADPLHEMGRWQIQNRRIEQAHKTLAALEAFDHQSRVDHSAKVEELRQALADHPLQ